MRVENVMTSTVETVTPETPLKKVAEILARLGVSGLPVVDSDKVVGVVSEQDILLKERAENPSRTGLLGLLLDDRAEIDAKLHARTAGEAMTAPAITIGPDRPLTEAAARMIDAHINRLPVVDDDEKLVGIVTRADLVRAFVCSDDEIAQEIKNDVVLRMLWIPPESIGVTVENGEVRITGQVETKAEAEIVPHFVQRVPGVVAVVSELTWATEGENGGRVPRP